MTRSNGATRPLIAVSMGDPVGIGPEVVVKALSVQQIRDTCDVVVFGDLAVLERARQMVQLGSVVQEVVTPEQARRGGADRIFVKPESHLAPADMVWAQPSPATDRAQLDYVLRALEAIQSGAVDALVTAPISKASIARVGTRWPGHTELLSEICGRWEGKPPLRPVMMLAGDHLKVVPLTTHLPLGDVPRVLTIDVVLHGIRVTRDGMLRYFGRHEPRIAVAGLNPHASENGLFGSEEREIIEPAIARAREEGAVVSGPLPADTVFRRAVEGEFDVVIGMYHDQALIPIKLLDFDRAVNVTLGLPIIRTSVDHGTAYDLAGQGVASAGSMLAALRLAASMVGQRRRNE